MNKGNGFKKIIRICKYTAPEKPFTFTAFAFIKYECFSDAQAAVSLLNKSHECGGLRVEMAKK